MTLENLTNDLAVEQQGVFMMSFLDDLCLQERQAFLNSFATPDRERIESMFQYWQSLQIPAALNDLRSSEECSHLQ